MYRWRQSVLEVLLVHPGGPLWKKKDAGAWSLPKGEVEPGEDLLETARREFSEETGFSSAAPFLPLGSIEQKSGKIVHAWGFAGDCEPATLKSNSFELEWPPRSGTSRRFPEIDRAEFFDLARARNKLNPAQLPLLDALERAARDAKE